MSTRIAERPKMRSVASELHEKTGDTRWLDPDYARRMCGPTMSAIYAKERKAAEIKRRRADPFYVYLKRMACSARKNAARRGQSYCLSDEALWKMWVASNGVCAVSGIPFSLDRHASGRAPLAPSIDRIDSGIGYVAGNVRLVCQLANLAMNTWGEAVLRDFIRRAT